MQPSRLTYLRACNWRCIEVHKTLMQVKSMLTPCSSSFLFFPCTSSSFIPKIPYMPALVRMLGRAQPEALAVRSSCAHPLPEASRCGCLMASPQLERDVSHVYSPVHLTDDEVDAICDGLRQNAAKARFLAGLGLHVNFKPNGRPLVVRAYAEQVLAGLKQQSPDSLGAAAPRPSPDRTALIQLFDRRAA